MDDLVTAFMSKAQTSNELVALQRSKDKTMCDAVQSA
jgi:hypothetical protein